MVTLQDPMAGMLNFERLSKQYLENLSQQGFQESAVEIN